MMQDYFSAVSTAFDLTSIIQYASDLYAFHWLSQNILGFQFPWYSQTVCTALIKKSAYFLHMNEGETSYRNVVPWQINKRQISQQQEVRYTFSGPLLQTSSCFPFHSFFFSCFFFSLQQHTSILLFQCLEYSSPLFGQGNGNMRHSVLSLIFISREIEQNARKILRRSNPIVTVSVDTLFSSNFTSGCFHDTPDLWCFIVIGYYCKRGFFYVLIV